MAIRNFVRLAVVHLARDVERFAAEVDARRLIDDGQLVVTFLKRHR
jgi:hypothetical protein